MAHFTADAPCSGPYRIYKLRILVAFILGVGTATATADNRSDCTAAAGTYLQGTVAKSPGYAAGHSLKGVELSHTRIILKGRDDGARYQIAIDNVFANGYDKSVKAIPPPFDTIQVGDQLEVCGQAFKGGLHWVHTNCGDTPTTRDPNGWVKKLDASGAAGENLEGSTRYCYLWPRK